MKVTYTEDEADFEYNPLLEAGSIGEEGNKTPLKKTACEAITSQLSEFLCRRDIFWLYLFPSDIVQLLSTRHLNR